MGGGASGTNPATTLGARVTTSGKTGGDGATAVCAPVNTGDAAGKSGDGAAGTVGAGVGDGIIGSDGDGGPIVTPPPAGADIGEDTGAVRDCPAVGAGEGTALADDAAGKGDSGAVCPSRDGGSASIIVCPGLGGGGAPRLATGGCVGAFAPGNDCSIRRNRPSGMPAPPWLVSSDSGASGVLPTTRGTRNDSTWMACCSGDPPDWGLRYSPSPFGRNENP